MNRNRRKRPAAVSRGANQVRCMATDVAAIAGWLLAHVGMIHATHEHYSVEVGATLSYKECAHILHMPKLHFVKELPMSGRPVYDYDDEQLEYVTTVIAKAAGLLRHYGLEAVKVLDKPTAFRLAFQRQRDIEDGAESDPDMLFLEPPAYYNNGVAKWEPAIFARKEKREDDDDEG